MTAKTMTPADLATELGTDARTARKFLRSITPKDSQPGKGARWSIAGNAKELAKLRKQFAEFTAKAEAERAARAEAKAAEAPTEEVEDEDEVPTDEELEPTDDELAEIENEG